MYLLDTNVISELRRARTHGAVVAWIGAVADHALHISAVSLSEIQRGIEITRRQDPARAAELEAWANQIGEGYEVVPMNGAVFRRWGRLMHGQSEVLSQDAMIAATALVHGLTVVTRNVRDFVPFGVPTVDPFAT